jgi:hypothetical protein
MDLSESDEKPFLFEGDEEEEEMGFDSSGTEFLCFHLSPPLREEEFNSTIAATE